MSPGESSKRVCTTVCLLRRAAAPRGLIDLTPQTVALDALRVKREMSRWVITALRTFRRDIDMTGTFNESTESQLDAGDKPRGIRRVGARRTHFWPVMTPTMAFRPSS